jgi:hypothetical protein
MVHGEVIPRDRGRFVGIIVDAAKSEKLVPRLSCCDLSSPPKHHLKVHGCLTQCLRGSVLMKCPRFSDPFFKPLSPSSPPPAQVFDRQQPDCRHLGKPLLVLVMSAEQTHAWRVDFGPCYFENIDMNHTRLDHLHVHVLNFGDVPVTGLPGVCLRLCVGPPLRAQGGREREKATASFLAAVVLIDPNFH